MKEEKNDQSWSFLSCSVVFIVQICKSVGQYLQHVFFHISGRKTAIWLTDIQVENQPGSGAETRICHQSCAHLAPCSEASRMTCTSQLYQVEPYFFMLGKHFIPRTSFTSKIQLYKKGKAAIRNHTSRGKKHLPRCTYAKKFF